MQRKVVNISLLLLLLLFFLILPATIETARAVERKSNKFCIVSVSPEELHPSEIETVRITLKNIGNRSAYRVSAEVLVKDLERAGSPVKVLGKARKSVGEPPFYAVGSDSEAMWNLITRISGFSSYIRQILHVLQRELHLFVTLIVKFMG